MNFLSAVQPPANTTELEWWFVFCENRLLVEIDDSGAKIPRVADIEALSLEPRRKLYIGLLDGVPCFSAELPTDSVVPEGMRFEALRGLFGLLDEDFFSIAGRIYQIINWDQAHQFCGRCGASNTDKQDERAKICPTCGQVDYPSASPAIIVAIRKDRQILLAQSHRFPAGRYSVLAGFVEPGETLEECVRREIQEEVGLKVKNIRYYGSQSWPFPNSLMVGFTSDYAGGEISVDNKEILDAKWFSAADIPQIPGKISIARKLIDWFADNDK